MEVRRMKTRIKISTLISIFGIGGFSVGSAQADGLTALHPNYTPLVDIQPSANNFLVGGLDFFSDGRMVVCTWGNPGEVWIVKNTEKGDKASVTSQRYAYGMQQVLGCRVVQDTVYVMQMG